MGVRAIIAKELHAPARRNYQRRRVTLKGLNDLYQADLVEMIPYARINKGFKYIMTVINCLSKFAFAVPLKNKTAAEAVRALEPILKKHKMKHLQTDDGKEWFNALMKKLTTKYNINHYSTFSEMKASICERLNRTLKQKMWREFTARGSYAWLELLPKIVKEYNGSVHRTIGMKPKDVKLKHVTDLLARIRGKRSYRSGGKKITEGKSVAPKLEVDDRVRISKYKRVFKKGYLPNWTNEVFRVYAVRPTRPVTYTLQDSKGEILKGGFYEQELSKSSTGDVYLVERVLKRKGKKVLVRWQGFDKSHDSWINNKDLK